MAARVTIDGRVLSRSERMFLAACVMEFVSTRTNVGELGLDVDIIREAAEGMAMDSGVSPEQAALLIAPLMRELAGMSGDEYETMEKSNA